MQLMNCPVCEGINYHGWIRLTTGGEYSLCDCGAAFLNPRMTDEELNLFYTSGDYRKKTELDDEGSKLAEIQHKNRAEYIVNLLGNADFESHLDIGCSSGHLLKAIEGKHPEIFSMGVDIDPVLKTSDFLIVETLEEVDREFDLITMIQTLEHINDPVKMLKMVYDRLAPNGLLVIEVPNRRASMIAFVPPQHVIAYDDKSLSYLLRDFRSVETLFHGMPDGSPLDLHILKMVTK